MIKVVHVGDPSLRKVAETVTVFDQDLKELSEVLIKTMYEYEGLGLAANQIGISKAICVIDVSKTRDSAEVYVNPQILSLQDEKPYNEGCLSLPGVQAKTKRATKIEVKYQSLQGVTHVVQLEGLKAIAMQHECEHLAGKLFIDQFGNMQQALLVDKHKKYIKAMFRRKF